MNGYLQYIDSRKKLKRFYLHHLSYYRKTIAMKKTFKKRVVTAVALLGFAIPTAAMAANVGGGEWHFGVGWTGTYGYSNYLHHGKWHSATVRNGEQESRDQASPGYWAQASITKIPPTGMSYHWNAW